MSKRPNFILFVTDQHRADYLGCYGHKVLKTPHIDALADTGVCYDKFYVASPVCMPNRASLMTCRWPSNHGVWTNGTPLARDHVTFVELLRAAGYDTALIGKSHLQNFSHSTPAVSQPEASEGYAPTPDDLAYAERKKFDDDFYKQELPSFWDQPDTEMSLPFYGFDHVDLVTGHGDGAGGAYRRWLRQMRPDADDLIGPENQLPHDYIVPQAVRTQVPEELYTTSWIADRTAEWLAARADSDKPFFLMVSWPDPHHPFNPPGKYWDMYSPDEMETPAAFENEDWTPPDYVQGAIKAREIGKSQTGGFGTFACSEREAREARALTCGMIAMIDDAVGNVMAELEKTGRADDTVKIFTSDHGDHLGDHKMLLKGIEMYEQITRVPFIWSDPDGPSATREDRIGQTQDIGTTILERAKVQAAWGMQGAVLPAAGGEGRKAALIQFDPQRAQPVIGPNPRVHTMRDSRYRLSLFGSRDGGEFYDLENDPDEFTNLWDDPDAAQAKAVAMEKLTRLEIDAADRVPAPEGMA